MFKNFAVDEIYFARINFIGTNAGGVFFMDGDVDNNYSAFLKTDVGFILIKKDTKHPVFRNIQFGTLIKELTDEPFLEHLFVSAQSGIVKASDIYNWQTEFVREKEVSQALKQFNRENKSLAIK